LGEGWCLTVDVNTDSPDEHFRVEDMSMRLMDMVVHVMSDVMLALDLNQI
jgi:hypothetical protein